MTDATLNPQDILKRVREDILHKTRSGQYDQAEIERIRTTTLPSPSGVTYSLEAGEDEKRIFELSRLCDPWIIEPVPSHRKGIVGGMIRFAKQAYLKFLSPFHNELLRHQKGFNAAVVMNIKGLESRYSALKQGEEEARVKINQMQSSFMELLPPVTLDPIMVVDSPSYGKREERSEPGEFYLEFENVFRGSESVICDRLTKYLEFIINIDRSSVDGHDFLDIGCGRGEFLKLLRENNVPAKGLEINEREYNILKGHKYNVLLRDANSYLDEVGDSSLRGISAFQVIEHFNYEYLNRFIQLSLKKIRSKGIIILETVNPKCTFTLGHTFYIDPTHLRPYSPEFLKYLLEWYGFNDIKIIYSSPCPIEFRKNGSLDCNYMDYGAVGYKP